MAPYLVWLWDLNFDNLFDDLFHWNFFDYNSFNRYRYRHWDLHFVWSGHWYLNFIWNIDDSFHQFLNWHGLRYWHLYGIWFRDKFLNRVWLHNE